MFLNLGLIFTAAAVLVLVAALLIRRIPLRRVVVQLGVALVLMLGLTAIFDNVMIAVGLFDYGKHTLSGLYIGLAPIEDFLYPLCAVVLMSGLWWLLGAAPTASEQKTTASAEESHD